MESIILIVGLIIVSFICIFAAKKYAQKVYNETGYNALNGLNKFLMVAIYALPLIVSLASSFYSNQTTSNSTATLFLVIPIIILLISNVRAKKPIHIIGLTLIQVLGGLGMCLLWLFSLVLRGGGTGLNVGIDTTQREVADLQQIQAQQIAQQDRIGESKNKEDIARAEGYAQSQGFGNADEAEEFGVRTGRPRE